MSSGNGNEQPKGEMRVSCVLEGVSPMLQHNFRDEDIESVLVRGKRPQKVTDMELREMARRGLWLGPENELGVKAEALLACLIEAGRFVKVGKRNLSTKDDTSIPGFLSVEDAFLPFEQQEEDAWVHDLRRGMMKSGTSKVAVGIVRPKFMIWGVPINLVVDFDEEGISAETIQQLLRIAGRRVGLGAFRPSKRGPFGRFRIRVGSWQVKPLEEASATE